MPAKNQSPTRSRRRQQPPTAPSPSLSPQPSPLSPSPTDLVQLSSRIPAEILQQIDQALQTGHWLLAVWRVANGKIELQRTATDFPTIDLDPAVKLLADDLHTLKTA